MFKIKGVKPPRKAIDPIAYEQAIVAAQRAAAETVKKDFEGIWSTWKHKPQVLTILTRQGGSRGAINLTVFVRDPKGIFHFVNKGTRAHIIRPKNGNVLVFRVPFVPKSLPLSLRAGPGKRGNNAIFASVVRHPGIKARRFDIIISRKNATTLKKAIDAEFRKIRP